MNRIAFITIFWIYTIFFTALILTNSIVGNSYFSSEINPIDAANLAATILMAIFVPMVIIGEIEKIKTKNSLLAQEAADYILTINAMHNFLQEQLGEAATKNKITTIMRLHRNHKIARRILCDQLIKEKSKSIKNIQQLVLASDAYWKSISDGRLLADEFVFDLKYLNGLDASYFNAIGSAKSLVRSLL